MSTELNEKILEIFDNNITLENKGGYHDFISGTGAAANEIEKLVLQEKIDLLENIKHGLIQKQIINNNINQLKEQLNLLK